MHSSACQLGEHVLPDRVARAGVVEAELAPGVGGPQAAQVVERLGSRCAPGSSGRRLRRWRRNRRCRCAPVTTRSWLPARQTSQRSRASATQPSGCRPVAHQVAETPDLVHAGWRPRRRARPRRPAGCRGRRTAGRCASGCLLQSPGDGGLRSRLPLAVLVAVGRRRAGHAASPPAQRPHRPGRGRRRSVLQPGSTGAGRGLSRHPAPDRPRPARADAAPRWRCWPGAPPRRLLDRARPPPAAGRRRGRGRASRCCSWRSGCRWRAWRHERAVDVGLSTQTWGPWLGDLAKSAGIEAVFAAVGGRRRPGARAALPAALVDPGHARSWWPSACSRSGSSRWSSTRCSTSSSRCPRASCAPRCSSWPTGPAWTWGRSTGWTPAAGPPR